MGEVCKICGIDFADDTKFNRHLRKHDLRMVEYYFKYHPRHDLYDGTNIKFKTKEQYFSADFNSRENAAEWFQNESPRTVRQYICDWLVKRKEKKSLIYAPSQVELRSLSMPGIKFIQNITGETYDGLCSRLGYKMKYNELFSESLASFHPNNRICIDTREQKPLSFSIKTKPETLSFGDYRFTNDKMADHGFIERKSISDFFGTLSAGFERFQRELERAKKDEAYLVILIEGTLKEVFDYPNRFRNISIPYPEFILHRMRDLIKEFDSIQFLFVDGRKEAARVIERIFLSNGQYKKVDLQYNYDIGIL